jgi:hypothetical protein
MPSPHWCLCLVGFAAALAWAIWAFADLNSINREYRRFGEAAAGED